MLTKRKSHMKKTKKPAKQPVKLDTNGVPRAEADRIAGAIIDNALARSKTKSKPPSEAAAATAIARAYLARGGFREDPTGKSPERIEIQGTSFDDDGCYFVDVRVYVSSLNIEHVVDGSVSAEDA
jgi:hypothetical protein